MVALRPAEVAVIIMTFSEYVCEPILFAIGMQDQESEASVKKLISLLALGMYACLFMHVKCDLDT